MFRFCMGYYYYITINGCNMKRFKEFLKEGGGFQVMAWGLLVFAIIKTIIYKL